MPQPVMKQCWSWTDHSPRDSPW